MSKNFQYDSFSDDDECFTTFQINEKNILDKKDDHTFIIKMSFRELCVYSNSWCFNRTIDDNKVKELYDSLCISYDIPFILHAVYDEKHSNPIAKILILDGQHRLEAIKNYVNKKDVNWECNFNVWICLYKIDNAETTNTHKVIQLFKKINNNRVFNINELPDTFIVDFVQKVQEIPLFKKNKVIKSNENTKTCHPPNIHIKELNSLFNLNRELIENLSISQLIENIQKINHKISLIPYDKMYDSTLKYKEKAKYEKAVAKCFFLNLKTSKFSPEVWIKYINNPEQIFTTSLYV